MCEIKSQISVSNFVLWTRIHYYDYSVYTLKGESTIYCILILTKKFFIVHIAYKEKSSLENNKAVSKNWIPLNLVSCICNRMWSGMPFL